MKNLATALFRHERIETTSPKAKALRPYAERLITLAKRGDLHARRLASRHIHDHEILRKLFMELGERYRTRAGGYTRILKVGIRRGDNADMSLIELVDAKLKVPEPEKKEAVAKQEKPAKEVKAPKAEKAADVKPEKRAAPKRAEHAEPAEKAEKKAAKEKEPKAKKKPAEKAPKKTEKHEKHEKPEKHEKHEKKEAKGSKKSSKPAK